MNPSEATWAATGVKVGAIESQLQRLWTMADDTWNGEGRRPDIRTSVLNLVIYAPDAETADRVISNIESLAGGHPLRTILLTPGKPHGEASIDANVSIKTRGAYAEYRQVCSEQLLLTIHGQAGHHIDSVVLPLLAPDLPLFVWWPGETPFRQHAFVQLRDAANRFIVDSDDFARYQTELVEMAHAVHVGRRHCAFSDFNWSRLNRWREMISQFFDPPQFRPFLNQLSTVEFECDTAAGGFSSRAQAMLLAGWLASRLGLRPVERRLEPDRHVFTLGNTQRTLTLHFHFHEPGAKPKAVPLVKMVCSGPAKAEFTLHRAAPGAVVTAVSTADGIDPLSRQVAVTEADMVQLLYQELEMFHHDTNFEETIDRTALLLDPGHQRVRGSMVD